MPPPRPPPPSAGLGGRGLPRPGEGRASGPAAQGPRGSSAWRTPRDRPLRAGPAVGAARPAPAWRGFGARGAEPGPTRAKARKTPLSSPAPRGACHSTPGAWEEARLSGWKRRNALCLDNFSRNWGLLAPEVLLPQRSRSFVGAFQRREGTRRGGGFPPVLPTGALVPALPTPGIGTGFQSPGDA